MDYFDCHTHILPGLDDGAKDSNESIALLNKLHSQKVGTVIATPHFYPSDTSISSFLRNRDAAFERLATKNPPTDLRIIAGAEVAFCRGLSESEQLASLCIENSNYILIELPYSTSCSAAVEEIFDLFFNRKLIPVLAHFERYIKYLDARSIQKLVQFEPLIFQFNARSITTFATRWKTLRLMRMCPQIVLGSDCHNMKTRAPVFDAAMNLLSSALPSAQFDSITETSRKICTVPTVSVL